ncbi:MAG: glycine cleavage system protein GcvH [Planctomycetota bacterium]
MSSPDDRRYLESHEWHKPDDGVVTIGITQFAVDELTDVTYVEFVAEAGSTVEPGQTIAEVESVKATSEIYTGVAGEIVAVNDAVVDDPSLINQDCFGRGWLIKVRPGDASAVDALLDAAAYDATTG